MLQKAACSHEVVSSLQFVFGGGPKTEQVVKARFASHRISPAPRIRFLG